MMRKPKTSKGYTKADLKAVSENPEWTRESFAEAKPFGDMFPELAKAIRRRGPQKAPTKQPVSIRLSRDVLEHYKSKGRGWQTQVDEALRKAANLGSPNDKRSSDRFL